MDKFDVIVVGGGIIGAAAAQHLVSSGYKTLLVEQNDYASGTSGKTSRIQHCGLTYFTELNHSLWWLLGRPGFVFEHLELARRAMRERADFVMNSPERVRKVEFVVPLGVENSFSTLQAKSAFWLLESFGGGKVPLETRMLSEGEARTHPILSSMRGNMQLRGAISFAEYQYVWPERIVIDTIVKARKAGLDARNYTQVTGLERDSDDWNIQLTNQGLPSTVRAKAVVNAAGAWVDQVSNLYSKTAPKLNTGAKGTNAVIRLPPSMHGLGMTTITRNGNPFYVVPWGNLHYIGPYDSPANPLPSEFRAGEAEIEAILEEMNWLFPEMSLARSDVLYSWAAVRPRTARPNYLLGAAAVTEHDLTDQGMPNFFVFTGGLLMTHRDAGRRLVRVVQSRVRPPGSLQKLDYATHRMPDENCVSPISVGRAISEEQAQNLSDILRRRLSVAWDDDLGLSRAEEAAHLAADFLGWDRVEIDRQLAAFRREIANDFNPAKRGDQGPDI